MFSTSKLKTYWLKLIRSNPCFSLTLFFEWFIHAVQEENSYQAGHKSDSEKQSLEQPDFCWVEWICMYGQRAGSVQDCFNYFHNSLQSLTKLKKEWDTFVTESSSNILWNFSGCIYVSFPLDDPVNHFGIDIINN